MGESRDKLAPPRGETGGKPGGKPPFGTPQEAYQAARAAIKSYALIFGLKGVSSWVKGCGSAGGSAAARGGDIQPEGVVGAPSTPISLEASRRGLHV